MHSPLSQLSDGTVTQNKLLRERRLFRGRGSIFYDRQGAEVSSDLLIGFGVSPLSQPPP